jgi:DNA processing protein
MSLAISARPELGYWIGFNRVPGIGVVRLRRLLAAFGDAQSAWEASPAELSAAGLQGRALQALLDVRGRFDPETELRRAEAAGVAVVTIDDGSYPRRLREIYAAPPVLFVKGELRPEDDLSVAIVGTRRVTGYGRIATEQIAGELAAAGVTIVSGFARGIDTVAHRATLDAGGRTIAVFACGLDVIYPPENRDLVGRVVERGAIVSEHALGVRPEATNFPARNRIVSGMTRATLVVEAGERSGALITARFAADQGRDVLAVPGPITAPGSIGTNALIKDGARLVTGAADVLAEIGVAEPGPAAAIEQLGLTDLLAPSDLERDVLQALADEPLGGDDLARALGRPAGEIASALTLLELKGRIRQLGAMNYLVRR